MKFYADFHIHSKYSRATANNLDLEHLYCAAQVKGITVIATGDFTHPAWFEEIKNKLEPSEQGLYKLRKDIAASLDGMIPVACRQPVRFMLVTEISNIYKKHGKTRKNHNLVFFSDTEAVAKFNRQLDKIGNIASDGRPILGLDSRDLLEIILETSPHGFLVPAHIWTPWFSLLGSKSGFDHMENCFEDLTEHIFAVETGLSSDPLMNRRVSSLDKYTLISNSDAHSPSKLGREANVFNTELSYTAIQAAMKGGCSNEFSGTIEFYPEEGKYHLDGHRKCDFRCHPSKTRQLEGICPVCGKPLTLGVLYRVEALADRDEQATQFDSSTFKSLIPLESILSEVFQVGKASKKVKQAYEKLINQFGSEFNILQASSADELSSSNIPLLAEAIERMRTHQVIFEPGYDGEFGTVHIFSEQERRQLLGQMGLFSIPNEVSSVQGSDRKTWNEFNSDQISKNKDYKINESDVDCPESKVIQLNSAQQAAVDHGEGPLLIIAGPGTGKTRTITSRIGSLIHDRNVAATDILAVTFTQKAAQEMHKRLKILTAEVTVSKKSMPLVTTFHGLCWQLIKEDGERMTIPTSPAVVLQDEQLVLLTDAMRHADKDGRQINLSVDRMSSYISMVKQQLLTPTDDLSPVVPDEDRESVAAVYAAYQDLLAMQQLFDFDDLIMIIVRRLSEDTQWREVMNSRWRYIFVDEFQDINYGQYQLIKLLVGLQTQLCVIGDPNQAIYGFRGSDWRYFNQFQDDYFIETSSSDGRIYLSRNYRSNETILEAAHVVIENQSDYVDLGARPQSRIPGPEAISLIETASAKAEAVVIGKTIETMLGGTGFHSVDFGTAGRQPNQDRSFSDFAVLFRTNAQGRLIEEVLSSAGIPCHLADHKAFQRHPVVKKIMALLRLMDGQAGYAQLNDYVDLVSPAVTKATGQAFRDWAYAQQLGMWQALQTAVKFPITGLTTAAQYRLVELVKILQELMDETASMTVAGKIELIVSRIPTAFSCDDDLFKLIIDQAIPFDDHLDHYILSQATQTDTDVYTANAEKVTLLSMHASKGLEFPIVFIAGCEDGLIPYKRCEHQSIDENEELRLLYVAMTRAREQLILTWARKRQIYGKTHLQIPSPFLDQIDVIQRVKNSAPQPKQRQLSLF